MASAHASDDAAVLAASLLSVAPMLDSMGFVRVVDADRAAGEVLIEFDALPRFCHSEGRIVQGGFVTAWLDFAMAQCARLQAGQPVMVASLEVKVSFLRRVGPGRVTAQGRVVRLGRRVAFLEASLFDASQTLLATASSSALIEPL